MKLAELQAYFARAATSGTGPLPELDAVFVTDAQLSASARLGIYNRAYYYRLLDALASVFERAQRALGSAEFERLALAYITAHPSEHPAVERVGRAFPEFLRARAQHETVVGLAELEWARLCALVAPNPQRVASRTHTGAEQFPNAVARLVPSLRWLELLPASLTAFAERADTAVSGVSSTTERCGVAVWRRQHAVHHERLAAPELQALKAAARGAKMSEICACFDTGHELEDAHSAFRTVTLWFEREWLESLDFPGA